MRTNFITAFALFSSFTATVHAADWPQWRGPNRDDHSPDKGLAKAWPASGPKRVWLFKDAGLGYSGVAVVGDTLFTMGLRGDTEFLIAVDAAAGKEKWATAMGPVLKNGWGDGPRGTPCVAGGKVYALSGTGFLLCASAADGKELWKARMAEFGGKTPGWGYTESVLVDGDLVICTPGGAKGTLLALDKASGKPVWQSAGWTDGAQYSSPVVATINGKRQYVQLTQQHVAGVEASSGKVLWRSDWQGKTAVIPTPIVKGNSVYIASGYGVGCKLVTIDAENKASDVWVNTTMVNHHGGVILVGEHLYGYSDKGGWTCQSLKTGEAAWVSKALGKGAVHFVDGMLVCLEEGSGTVALVEVSTEGWKEKGRFKLAPQTTQRNPKRACDSIAVVPSVDAPSATTHSKSRSVWFLSDSINRGRCAAALYVALSTLRVGRGWGCRSRAQLQRCLLQARSTAIGAGGLGTCVPNPGPEVCVFLIDGQA